MERLTTNKNVSDMGMVELALNCCYIAKDGSGRYRDYEIDMDERDFVRKLTTTLVGEDLPLQDESFDEEMMDNLGIDPLADVRGLIAIFYRNMWAMAELREKLKRYEDAEEQELLIRLPCKVGTIIYKIENNTDACCKCNDFKTSYCDDDLCGNKNGHDEGGVFYVFNPQYADKPLCKKQFYEIKEYEMKTIDEIFWRRNDFCKTVFFTRKEAEAKLKELRGAE